MTYKSIANNAQGLYKDRGSRFISFAFRVSNTQEVKEIVESLKKEHHAAKHHCYAYRIGASVQEWRANDDGEPSQSAGRQILASIDSAGVSDTLVVVVRYFGGILLGVPGLIKAYREASAQALENAGTTMLTECVNFTLGFGYEKMSAVRAALKSVKGASIVSQELDMQCTLKVSVPLSEIEDFKEKLKDYIKDT